MVQVSKVVVSRQRKGSPKGQRMGNKQKHGHSRAAYAAIRAARIAANKERRIEKDARVKAKAAAKKGAR
jgi:hypothetical protein